MERIVILFFVAWLAVMAVGIIIALMPLILSVVGFVLMLALIAFIGRLVGSCFGL